jgi:hypothetical protein
MDLETIDGKAVLAYAGLGMTAAGTQPSEWMAATLRGRGGLDLEPSLGLLADVALREMPKHLTEIGSHMILAPALLKSGGPRMFSIAVGVDVHTREPRREFLRWERQTDSGPVAEQLKVTGTGGVYLQANASEWVRPLLRLIKANEHGRASDLAVADFLARLNHQAHSALTDGTVGPNCVVVWRRGDRPRNRRGGAHQWYEGRDRSTDEGLRASIPTIGNGMDVQAVVGVLTDLFFSGGRGLDGFQRIAENFPVDEVNERLRQLPGDPDERLT